MVEENATRRVISERLFPHSPDRDAASRLGRITAPSLVLHGDHDHPEVEVIASRRIADILNALGQVIPHADRYLPLRIPERLSTLLLAHLR
ncbi:hypothetical protein [Streptomyces sp. NBC_00648]|uniref:alpha/beta fold hydrolase n=1 Tax=Streptomyces sp. NBC_00648 TaxID=2975797 RepID=UPI002F917E86